MLGAGIYPFLLEEYHVLCGIYLRSEDGDFFAIHGNIVIGDVIFRLSARTDSAVREVFLESNHGFAAFFFGYHGFLVVVVLALLVAVGEVVFTGVVLDPEAVFVVVVAVFPVASPVIGALVAFGIKSTMPS